MAELRLAVSGYHRRQSNLIHVPFFQCVELRKCHGSIALVSLAHWGRLGRGPGQLEASVVFRVVHDAVTAPLVVVTSRGNAVTPAAAAAVLVHVLADELDVPVVLCESAAESLAGLQGRAEGERPVVVGRNSVSTDAPRRQGRGK